MKNHLRYLFYPEKISLFPYLDGLRALSILWVMSFHILRSFGEYIDKQAYIALTKRIELNPFLQGHLGVDVFFVLSGFLIAYYLFSEYKNKQGLNIKKFYLRRALRIFPAYFIAMLLFAVIYPKNLSQIWANILYVNNFLPLEQQFMTITWSLAIEEHFYILFPGLILFFGTEKRLFLILIFLFLLSFIIRFLLVYLYQIQLPLPVHESVDKLRLNQYYNLIYDKSYTRYGCLLTGVLTAYLTLFTNTVTFLKQHIFFAACCGLSVYLY